MKILEDILDALGVNGDKAERIIADLTLLAESRAGRALVVQLPKAVRAELDLKLEETAAADQVEEIGKIIESHCSETEREDAFRKALEEVLEEEFLPTVAESATEEQLEKIRKLIDES